MSQAVFTPDEAAIGTNSLFLFRPSLFQWTERQYTEDGPFDKWLRDVKTCRTRTKCCGPSGFSNIIIRDFPSRAYASNVVAKNYKSSSTASGSEGQCERNAVAEEERIAREKAEAEKKAREEAARKAKEEAERRAAAAAAAAKAEAERKAREEAAKRAAAAAAAAKAAAAAAAAAKAAALAATRTVTKVNELLVSKMKDCYSRGWG